eukprot:Pompholyxophrys_punicea_v1_NODE_375_length_2103_cov_7.343750.p3 type:complete len:103 gc:universal NODE_375_length_2103_cov_7.343750:1607-1915(+)
MTRKTRYCPHCNKTVAHTSYYEHKKKYMESFTVQFILNQPRPNASGPEYDETLNEMIEEEFQLLCRKRAREVELEDVQRDPGTTSVNLESESLSVSGDEVDR